MDLIFNRRLFSLCCTVLAVMFAGATSQLSLYAQPTPAPATDSVATNSGQSLPALQLEMTNAYQRVLQIVNQPVKAYVRGPNIDVSVYKPGWFHEGASVPDFNTVDVRQSQELTYAQHKFVTSDVTPNVVYLGADLEFNSMTKLFYTNRNLPKRKLSEAEMLEINRLYRIIGRCKNEISLLKAPPAAAAVQPEKAETEIVTEEVVPNQSFESIRKIPKQTRLLYGGGAIGVLLLLLIAARFLRKGSS